LWKQKVSRGKTPRPNQVRIIGGTFRSRKLAFPPTPGLRPTGDRIRETLFNWLQPVIVGSYCLDLFAGSGALGMEALSRGAAQVTFIDTAPEACDSLRRNLDLLDPALRSTGQANVARADSLHWLGTREAASQHPVNLVFLDPPFAANLLELCCQKLAESPVLAPGCLIYLEQPRQPGTLSLPASWIAEKDKCAGNVRYQLFRQP
jgi:16S rRNA (guanine966-N2)-methyltransferase